MKSLSYLTIIFLISMLIHSCKLMSQPEKVFTGTKNKKAADLYNQSAVLMMEGRLAEAEQYLIRAIREDSNYVDAYMRLSSIYLKQGKTELERKQYEKVLQIQPKLEGAYFNYAHLLMRVKEYQKSIEYFNRFLQFENISDNFYKKALQNIRICEYRDSMIKNPVPFNPVNLGNNINTELDEYWPAMTADEQNLFFTRKLDQNPNAKFDFYRYNEDIFYSINSKEGWQQAIKLPSWLNALDKNEGAICVSPDGKYLLFTICSEEKDFGYGVCDIYISEFMNNEWQPAKNIGPPINTAAKETQPSISFDGKTIYFSSNRGGTLGKLDIWRSTKNEDGSWSVPENLGPEINGPENEQSPFIHPDNQTLYFSSESRLGMGGADLYVASINEEGKFNHVRNLGYPVNTDKDEISLFVTAMGDKAFFASRREGGYGGLDIYSFLLYPPLRPKPVCYLKGIVFNKENQLPLGAYFEIVELESGKTIIKSTSDGKTGKFLIALPVGKRYLINVSKEGYLFYSDHLSSIGLNSSAFEKRIPLTPVKAGETIILNNIFFDFDKSVLKPESYIELKKVIELLNLHKTAKIEISGHTDNYGDDNYNLRLSESRAKAVYDYLINVGKIDPLRLSFKGYGESKPIDTNDTEAGRARNRRTEIKIISI